MAGLLTPSSDVVIEDLEQMVLHPTIFLTDAGNFELRFGQQFYGQKKEISKLLAISAGSSEQTDGTSSILAAETPSEVLFVTSVAGIGKTHLVKQVGEYLSSLGSWIVVKTYSKRDITHESRDSISLLFDRLIASIVAMRN